MNFSTHVFPVNVKELALNTALYFFASYCSAFGQRKTPKFGENVFFSLPECRHLLNA